MNDYNEDDEIYVNYSDDDEVYDVNYSGDDENDDDDENDINNPKPPQFPSQYRIDNQYFKMPTIPQVRQFKSDREYFVITFDTHEIFRGTFDHWDTIGEITHEYYTTYEHMPNRQYCRSCTNHYFTCNNKKYMFNDYDYYYYADLFMCQIKRNANTAREQMEERALDIILKKVVNEEFQWSSLV